MNRGYVRPTPRFPAQKQIDALVKAGVREQHIYVEGRGAESWAEFVKALRNGDAVVVDGLHRLGVNRADLHTAFRDVAAMGCVIMDAGNNMAQLDPNSLAAVAEAYRVLTGELRIPTHREARRRGIKGGRPALELDKYTEGNREIWLNARSNQEAEATTGLPWRRMLRKWGPSGRLGGWPRKIADTPGPKVYFLRAGESGAVKIGFATDLRSRIRGIETGNHEELHIIAAMNGTAADEKALHKKFAAYRIRGEWFKYAGDLKRFIEALPQTTTK